MMFNEKLLVAIATVFAVLLASAIVIHERETERLESEIHLLQEMDSEKRGLIRRLIKENERLFAEMKEEQR